MDVNIPAEAPAKKGLNPLFLVLAALSALPAAFFALVYVTGSGSGIAGFLTLWSALWTWVWYAMAKRH